jgi:HEAT repeat protein
MADKLPLDARLLSNAVIELNIARHILALYSREHQLVQLSLDKTFAILSDLFEVRPEIGLAVAKDTLIIDGRQLDHKNAVYREFALALSRMSVALVTFVKGLTREEVYDFFRFLSRETTGVSSETLPQILAEYQLRHIRVEPVDYRVFTFAEERKRKKGSDEYLLEHYIKALLDGELPLDGVQAVIENVEPGTLAVLVNQDGGEVARAASYDTVVSSYLRSGAGKPVTGGDLQRLMTFIAGLRPELKQQFLASSVKSLARDPGALGQALERVSVDSIIEFVAEIDRTHVALPGDLGTLIARFARTGVELPGGGLNVDDVLLSPEVASLFHEDESHQHGPQSYEAEIQRIVEQQVAVSGPDGSEVAHELEEAYVRYCHANALLALLDSPLPGLTTLEDEDAYAAAFSGLAKQAAGSGQYAQLLELLTRFEELERRAPRQGAVRTVREYYRDPAFVAGIVDSFRRHGRANREGAALICAFYGRAIVPPLFDLLADEERMYVRRLLLQLLIGLGAETIREAPQRLQDPRWHVRRNTLYLIAECRGRLEPALLAPLADDADPRVRLECARCLLLAGDAAGVPVLRALLRAAVPGVVDAAIAIAGALGVAELLPELVALARKPTRSDGIRQRLRVVRALGRVGGERAAAALRELLELRISLFPGENKRFRGEIRKMLKRLAAKQETVAAEPAAPAGVDAQ